MVLLLFCGCSSRNIELGKWKMETENHKFVIFTEKDAHTLGEPGPAPFPAGNKQGWSRVKDIGESPENIQPKLNPYSVTVIESGYTILQSTRHNTKSGSYDDIEWGWKVTLENKSKRGIYAYGGYSLFDDSGFILNATGNDWDNNESGVFIKAGEKGIVQGRGLWRVDAATKPYPPSRVSRGDYKLFLRHDIFEKLD